MKFKILFFCTIFCFSCVANKKEKQDEITLLLLYLIMNENNYSIECIDDSPNLANQTPVTITENCNNPLDPLYLQQWHFLSTSQSIHMGNTWNFYCGTGVKVAIIDDGLEMSHEDLSPNIEANKSYNYKDLSNDPTKIYSC